MTAFTLFEGVLQHVVPHAELCVESADTVYLHRIPLSHIQRQFLADQRQYTQNGAFVGVALAGALAHEFLKTLGCQLHSVVGLCLARPVQVGNLLFDILCIHSFKRLFCKGTNKGAKNQKHCHGFIKRCLGFNKRSHGFNKRCRSFNLTYGLPTLSPAPRNVLAGTSNYYIHRHRHKEPMKENIRNTMCLPKKK